MTRMGIPRTLALAVLRGVRICCILLFAFAVTPLRAANEKGLWDLWQQHIGAPDAHEAVISACKTFIAQNAADELVPVATGIQAWHLFKQNKLQAGAEVLRPYLRAKTSPPAEGASLLAKAWLSRLDLLTLKAALQLYYRAEVAYPSRIEELKDYPRIPETQQPPLTDRWGHRWRYQLVGFKSIPRLINQKYALGIADMEDTSDLETALSVPYGARIGLTPTRAADTQQGVAIIEFTDDRNETPTVVPLRLQVGNSSGSIFLAYVGQNLVIVCDRLHWKVFPKPRAARN